MVPTSKRTIHFAVGSHFSPQQDHQSHMPAQSDDVEDNWEAGESDDVLISFCLVGTLTHTAAGRCGNIEARPWCVTAILNLEVCSQTIIVHPNNRMGGTCKPACLSK